MKTGKLALAVGVVTLLVVDVACANAGTPLMWAGMLHLAVGNLLIGLLEAYVVSRWFRVERGRLYGLAVAGNYLSMIIGVAVLGWVSTDVSRYILGAEPLYHGVRLLVVLVVAAYVLSVIIEWPFFAFGLHREIRTARFSFRASLLAQTVSYVLLIPFYLLASGFSLFTQAKLTRSLDFVVRKDAVVYFISPSQNSLCRLRLDGTPPESVLDLKPMDRNARLFVRKSKDEQVWDLWLLDFPDYIHDKRTERLLLEKFAAHAVPTWRAAQGHGEESTWFNFGPADSLRALSQSNWTVRTGFWAIEGLWATNEKTGQSLHLCLELPFIMWVARNATVLPGDQVVYQLDEQVVLLDLNTRKLAFLTLGQGPVVGLPAP